MTITHALFLIFIVPSSVISGLISVALIMDVIRTVLGKINPKWTPASVFQYEARTAKEGWLHRCLVAFDIAVNVILLRGQQDETISTHAYRASLEGKLWGRSMSKWLDWIQPNHGQKAASGDLYRAQSRVDILRRILGV